MNDIFKAYDFENEQQWLKGRMNGIGGSDASAVVGMNPYKSNIDLFEEKIGRVIPKDISDKPCVIYGKKAEEFDAVLTARGARKAARFVKFCDAFNIPVLTLTNVTGFKADKHSERCIATAVAEMTHAFADATVPKVNVIIGKAYGSAYVAMNSKAVGADMTYAWEDASIGMMDAKLAAKIMYADADAATIGEKAAEYASLQESVQSAAARGYVDTIISAEDTRKYVIGAFEMLFTKREDRPAKKHGTV